MWIAILKRQVEQKGAKQVAYELGIGRSTVSLLCQRKYPAGTIDCPVLGGIDPSTCVNCWTKAKKIGMKASNPETLRLYKTCTSCTARGG